MTRYSLPCVGCDVSTSTGAIKVEPNCYKFENSTMSVVVPNDPMRIMQYFALCGALKLETLGMKRSRSPSAYAIMKRQYGFKGNRAKVLQQAQMVKSWLKENS